MENKMGGMGVALALTSAAIVVFLISQSAMAFIAGDKVKLSMNSKLGPFTLEKCFLEDSQQVCKLKEAGYYVNASYLRKIDSAVKVEKTAVNDTAAVGVQVLGR